MYECNDNDNFTKYNRKTMLKSIQIQLKIHYYSLNGHKVTDFINVPEE